MTIKSRLIVLSRNFGDQDISTLTEKDVKNYSIKRRSQRSKNRDTHVTGSMVRKELKLLKGLLNWAKDKKGVEVNVDIKGNFLPDEGEAVGGSSLPLSIKQSWNGVVFAVHGFSQ